MALQPSVEKLINILENNSELKNAVVSSLQAANYPELQTLEKFYAYLDRILTHIPNEKELMPTVREFYYVLGKSPDNILKHDKIFNEWINEFVISRGNFLDTTASAATLDSFINCPDYNINDYIKGPSGWLTYNQFLARQMKPGKRPVASPADDSVIVSPADSEFKGIWEIEHDSNLTVKGTNYKVADLLPQSPYWPEFKGGIFTHSFLSISNYHRYHTPVAGIIKEVKVIPANTWITEQLKEDGSITNVDNIGFQFEHTRGYIIIESKVGYVAVIPVGMGHISSVNLTVDEGDSLVKGEEFGFFGFGGSDIIMLFQSNRVQLFEEEGVQYKQGQKIGIALMH